MKSSQRLRRRQGLLLALVSAALFGVAAVAYAAIPDDNGSLYHACMLKGVGTIRLIDPSLDSARGQMAHCTRMETEITWGQVGPKGDTGPKGDPGPTGTVAYATAYSGERTASAGGYGFGNAICPKDTIAVGGGYTAADVTAPLSATASYPTTMADGRTAWYVLMRNGATTQQSFYVMAFCAVNAKIVYLG